MMNYQNFKSTFILKENPLVMDTKTVKVSDMPKGAGTDAKRASFEIYTDNKNMILSACW